MKILNLEISNFKAARRLQLHDLGDVVVVAGPNGCGKSCVLDAIRFLKSNYAGYRQQDDWRSYFSELQLNVDNPDEVRRLFYDRKKPITISADFAFSNSEVEFVAANAKPRILERLWKQQMTGRSRGPSDISHGYESLQEPSKGLEASAGQYAEQIIEELKRPVHKACVTLDTTPSLSTTPNLVLEFVFSIYDPANIGIIDYHSPHRTYQREKLGGINVNIEETAERLAQHALFNWQGKYTNIKSELAAAFIRDLFIEKAGGSDARTPSILKTMEELFGIFLPGKTFNGPRPGRKGELTFPVKLSSGGEHDIDDLSSGEKELVYGYLRLRNVALACTRFRRHRVRCFDGAGGGSWRDGSLRESSSLRPCA